MATLRAGPGGRVVRRSEKSKSGMWVVKAQACLACRIPLGLRHRKHHCYVCGELFCTPCVSFAVHDLDEATGTRLAARTACAACLLAEAATYAASFRTLIAHYAALHAADNPFPASPFAPTAALASTNPAAPPPDLPTFATPAHTVPDPDLLLPALADGTASDDDVALDDASDADAHSNADALSNADDATSGDAESDDVASDDAESDDGPDADPAAFFRTVPSADGGDDCVPPLDEGDGQGGTPLGEVAASASVSASRGVRLQRIWLSIKVSELNFPPSPHTGFYAMVLYSKPWGSIGSLTRYVEAARTEVVSRGAAVNSASFATLLALHRPASDAAFDLSPLKFAVYMSSGDNLRLPAEEDLVGAIRVSGSMNPGQHATTELKTRRGVAVGQLTITAEGIAPPFDSDTLVHRRYKLPAVVAPSPLDDETASLVALSRPVAVYVDETLQASSYTFSVGTAVMLASGLRHIGDFEEAVGRAGEALQHFRTRADEYYAAAAAGSGGARGLSRPKMGGRTGRALADVVRVWDHLYSIQLGLAVARSGRVGGLPFKPSTAKAEVGARFLATNLQVQRMSVFGAEAAVATRSYATVTFGAAADHASGFKRLGIRQLEATLLDTLRGSDGAPLSEETRGAVESMQWELLSRKEAASSQALAALITSFAACVNSALQDALVVDEPELIGRADHLFDLLASVGFVFELESLLSTKGKELGMLGDLDVAMASLRATRIVLHVWEEHHAGVPPPTQADSLQLAAITKFRSTIRAVRSGDVDVAALHTDVAALGILPQLVDIDAVVDSSGVRAGDTVVRLWITLPRELDGCFPPSLAAFLSGASVAAGGIEVFPFLFTQGINEKQSLANFGQAHPLLAAFLGSSETQAALNTENLDRFLDWYSRVRAFVALRAAEGAYTVADVAELDARADEIAAVVAAAERDGGRKNLSVLTKPSAFVRTLGGGRATCCKSAKDRTSMAVTLEQTELLVSNHGLTADRMSVTSVMRSHGVRRTNAFHNIGKKRYAFNSLQKLMLPAEYRPPDGAGGSYKS